MNAEYEEQADQANEFRELDDDSLRDMLMEHLVNVMVLFEKIYADIFLGRYDQAVFQSDFLGSEWWKNLQYVVLYKCK